ncbi:vacuolar sorting protein 9 domain-containing protein [Encephalitozoon hellem]|nr:vacuolar sorting protein 9 domain-containing protein [Encephalitozoon hellem]
MKCRKACTKALLSLSLTPAGKTIDSFTRDIKLVRDNPALLQTFYEYISIKYGVRCEVGIGLVERMIMVNSFKQLMDIDDPANDLVNKKILLYRWIGPEHLEIENVEKNVLENISEGFKGLSFLQTPTEKISCIMNIIEKLYESIGRNEGQDKILPSIVYCIIKSSVPNMYLEARFMVLYRRKHTEKCNGRCNHGLNIEVDCECLLNRIYDEREVSYYLTSVQAAVDFIRRMEFYDLKISEGEFYRNIMDAMELVRDS